MKKNITHKYLYTSVLVALIFGLLVFLRLTNAQNSEIYLQNKNYIVQLDLQSLYETSGADVVMLGNSLTFNVNWSELLNRKTIINRGIIGDITQGYLHRLDYIYKLNPKLCFIEGGINDFYANFSVEKVFDNYIRVLKELKKHGIIPVIQSTIYVAKRYENSSEKNILVQELNNKIHQYAIENKIDFININSAVSNQGYLDDKFTYDGIHLNANGYKLWKPLIEKILQKYKL